MKSIARQHSLLRLASLVTMVGAYTLVSNASRVIDPATLPGALGDLMRPDVLPPTQAIAGAFAELVTGWHEQPVPEEHVHPAALHVHSSEHVMTLLNEGVTLQASLAISAARVLFGLAVGVPLGFFLGFLMGWSRRADDYLHPIYVLARSVPPLAFITYIMLWLGHTEAHRLIPIVYAVAVTVVIPTYHAVRDVSATYVLAARSLGARGRLLFTKVVLPAASPALLGGLRYAIVIAWMTAVGAEMLMAENGMGNLIVGGGMWATRFHMRTDPAVVMAGIIALAAAGWAMDAGARGLTARLTRWLG